MANSLTLIPTALAVRKWPSSCTKMIRPKTKIAIRILQTEICNTAHTISKKLKLRINEFTGCPVGIDIPAFIAHVAEKDYEGAYQVIAESSSLPAVCGRVCPQETQCEKHCVRAIKGESVGIGRLERFVADYHNNHSKAEAVRPVSNGHRVAVIGSGPAGLTCAGELARMGYDVTVFEDRKSVV